jgi:putative transcriptional regulator
LKTAVTRVVDIRKVLAELSAFSWSRIDGFSDLDIARQVASSPDAPPMLSETDVRNLLASGRARLVRPLNVRAIRNKTGLSQERFAATFSLSLASLRNWEQGRRHPEGAARVLLTVIDREPQAVMRALSLWMNKQPS